MSTKKRQTRVQREAAERAALRLRVSDIVAGAAGSREYDDTDNGHITPSELSRIIPALQFTFAEHIDGNWSSPVLWAPWNLGEYETVDQITDFLIEHGMWAGGAR